MSKNKIVEGKIPRHIAIIMDGNGRWAKKRLLPRSVGHAKGLDRMVGLLERAFDLGVEFVTLYALSVENLSRPAEEIKGLCDLVRTRFSEYIRRVCARGVQFRIIGDVSLLPQDVQKILRDAEKETEKYAGRAIYLALCYGGRDEIVRAANLAIEKGERVTKESFAKLLYTADCPDPDLIIRTGKEVRLSNFLLWQAAYAELYFSDKMFPDFSDADLEEAFAAFASRTRRFGKTEEQLEEK